jgi:CheY-like chemotaxis protein
VGRVLLLSRDLMFPSSLAGQLEAAGIETQIAADPAAAGELVAGDLIVVDLTAGDYEPASVVAQLAPGVRSAAFFAHVEPQVRDSALAAGVEHVYPRSRVAREGAALAATLLG